MSMTNTKTRYSLIQIEAWNGPYWMEDDGTWWRNEAGGGFPKKGMAVKVFETVEADCIDDLDHTKTHFYTSIDPNSMDGWCSPDGKFHPCGYFQHDQYAHRILKKATFDLEKEGWARCHSSRDGDAFFVTRDNRRLTPEQRNTLSRRGFNVEDYH